MRISHELSILIMYAVNYLVKTVHKKRKTFRITNKRQISWWMRRRHDIHTHCAPVDWIKVDKTYMLTVQCALVMKLGSGIFRKAEGAFVQITRNLEVGVIRRPILRLYLGASFYIKLLALKVLPSLKGLFTNFEYLKIFSCPNERNIFYKRSISIKQF